MNQRARQEEAAVPKEYIEKLHLQHEKVFVTNKDQLNCPVYVVDGSQTPDIVRAQVLEIIKVTLKRDFEVGYYKKI